jgi:3-deoxy-D-manno-octulosonic-acid transferase
MSSIQVLLHLTADHFTSSLPVASPSGKNASTALPWRVYRTAWRALGLIVPFWLGGRALKGKEEPLRLQERYGDAMLGRPQGPLFWVHAASVGEANAILPLVQRLLEDEVEWRALITTGTRTSAELLAKKLPPRALHQYIPLDHPRYVRRFLDHWQPQLVLWTESELWPNLLQQTAARNIPLWLVNGRMSPSSFANWQKFPELAASLLSVFTGIYAGSERDAEHYRALAANVPVQYVGNLKYDAPELPTDMRKLTEMRENIGHRPVLLAASLHPGEDIEIAQLHRRLQSQQWPDLLTIIVPRHAARGDAIASLLRRDGHTVAQRSRGESLTNRIGIYLADTMGELGLFYRVATVVFMGGSLVPHGGQNPLEAARLGVPVVSGLYMQNFAQVCDILEQAGAFKRLLDADALAHEVAALLESASLRQKRVNCGYEAIAAQGGALDKLVRLVEQQMRQINRYVPLEQAAAEKQEKTA